MSNPRADAQAGLRVACLAAALGVNGSLRSVELSGWTWSELGNGCALPFLTLGSSGLTSLCTVKVSESLGASRSTGILVARQPAPHSWHLHLGLSHSPCVRIQPLGSSHLPQCLAFLSPRAMLPCLSLASHHATLF